MFEHPQNKNFTKFARIISIFTCCLTEIERHLQPPDAFDPWLEIRQKCFCGGPEPLALQDPDVLAGTEGPLRGKGKERKRKEENERRGRNGFLL